MSIIWYIPSSSLQYASWSSLLPGRVLVAVIMRTLCLPPQQIGLKCATCLWGIRHWLLWPYHSWSPGMCAKECHHLDFSWCSNEVVWRLICVLWACVRFLWFLIPVMRYLLLWFICCHQGGIVEWDIWQGWSVCDWTVLAYKGGDSIGAFQWRRCGVLFIGRGNMFIIC